MYTRILVPLDGTYLAERAVPYAAALARAWQARLLLYHNTLPSAGRHHPDDERVAGMELDKLAADLRATGLQVESVIDRASHDSPAEAITSTVSGTLSDLIVMASHGRSGVEDAILGASAERVARGSEVPVLVVPALHDAPWSADGDRRVLVPLDGSAAAEAALGPAQAVAELLNWTLLLARIVEPRRDQDELATTLVAEGRAYLERLARDPRLSRSPVEVLVEVGEATVAIAGLAEQRGVELIVMATHARTGLGRVMLGSVTEATLRRAAVPVLVVPPAR